MTFKPRDYQDDAIVKTLKYINDGGSGGLICLPTGSGKASYPAFLLERLFKTKPFTRAMMLTHRKTLIEQNYETLKKVWSNAPCGIYSAGLKRKDSYDQITYAGIQSVYKKADLFGKIDIVVVDEVHLISPKSETMYGKFISELRANNPNLVLIGMTATPFRLDSGMLIDGDLFDDIIVDRTLGGEFTWFLDQGYLCEIHARDVDGRFDTSDVKKRGGEFLIQSLTEKFNRTEVSQKIVNETIRRRGTRKHGMCFAISIEHAEELARMFTESGVPATVAHSNLDDAVVEENVAAYMRGEYEMLVDVERYTTGFDYPGIDLIVMARPTESAALWIQCCGRGTRPVYAQGFDLSTVEGRLAAIAAGPKPDGCLLLDFAGNGLRLGPMNAPITAGNKAESTSDGTALAPQKICPVCLNYVHAAQRWCGGLNSNGTRCGYEFPQGEEVAMSGEIIPGILIRRDWLREDRLFDVVRSTVKSGQTLTGKPFILVTLILKGVSDPLCLTMYMTDAAYNFSRDTWRVLMPKVAFPYLRGVDVQINIDACRGLLDESFNPSKAMVWVNFSEGGKVRPKLLEVG